MAYNTQEERLKVKGSEQITRDLKVNRDLFVTGEAKVGGNDVLTTADKTNDVVENSTDVLTSGGAYTALATKQDVLTFDDVPTQNSDNPVKSGGVYNALATKINLTEKGASNGVATLDATGRVPYSQLPESAMEYQGTWDASTNTPTLADGVGTNGDFYVVSAGGTVNFGTAASPRNVTFYINDRVIYDGNTHQWARLPAGEVRSVNGHSGDVTLTASDVGAATSTDITNAINALDVTDTAVSGKYVSAVSETDGKITVTRADLPASGVTGVKGNNESTYRTGNVNLTAANVGALPDDTRYGAMLDINSAGDTITLYDQYGRFMGDTVTVTDVAHSDKATAADYTRETAYCTTAAATAAKVANMLGYSLQSGATFPITFTNANTAASALTLAVNNTTARPIYINNAASSSSNHTLPAGTYICRYDGINYYIDTGYAVTQARNCNFATQSDYTRGNAYCTSIAGTGAKVASMVGYVLATGGSFPITFTTTNTAASKLTLNVNNKGAKDIWINGAVTSSTNHTLPAGTYMCYYDGTNYYIDTEYAVSSARNASTADTLFGYVGSTPHKLSATISGSDHDIIRLKDTSNNLSLDYAHAISADNASSATVSGALTNIYDDSRTLNYNTLHLDSTNSTITHENQYTYFEFSNTILPNNYSIVLVPGANGAYYFGLTIPAPTPGGIAFIEISKSIITLSTSSTGSDTKCKFRQLGVLDSMDINYINLN